MDKRNTDWYLIQCLRIPLLPPIKECKGFLYKFVMILLYCTIYAYYILGMVVIGVISYLLMIHNCSWIYQIIIR